MSRKPIFVLSFFLVVLVFIVGREIKSQDPAPPPPPPRGLPAEPLLPIIKNIGPKQLPNIWSIQMEQVKGRNVIRATIGKQNDIRIECDNMDYQTQKGMFLAFGKVEFSGTNVQCQCDKLIINLNEDSLTLEGKAQVQIAKVMDKYQNPEGILLAIKGEQLSVRWPDLLVKANREPIPAPKVDYEEKKKTFDVKTK